MTPVSDDYLMYLKKLYTLSRLDMVVILPDGTAAARYIHRVHNISMSEKRKKARESFLRHKRILYQQLHHWENSEAPELYEGYYFFGICVQENGESAYLVLGPFYIEEDVQTILESGLPHYSLMDLPSVRSLFIAQSDEEAAAVPQVRSEDIERADTNDKTLITSNARYERTIRAAVTAGDPALLELVLQSGHFADAGHYDTNQGPLHNRKNLLLAYNTVMCRAAEDGGASSVQARSLCADLAERIDRRVSISEMVQMHQELPFLYCNLVAESRIKNCSVRVRHCQKWLMDHLTEEPTLQAAAEACQVSYEHLSRCIKKDCGCGFLDLLHAMRCRRAQVFLMAGFSVMDTAQKVGYHSSSEFCRAFRRLYNLSPGQWQTQHENF